MAEQVDSESLTFNEYQRVAGETDIQGDDPDPTIPLLGLAGEVGSLLSEFKKQTRPDGRQYAGFDEIVQIELGDCLWYLAAVARRVEVSLGGIAKSNLAKTRDRWLDDPGRDRLAFDAGFPTAERIPRQFNVEFTTYEEKGILKSQMVIAGEEVGEPIDDNSRYRDAYRFHDVFHLGYAAVLGWSPVLRSLLGRKRKSDADVDRSEDGARACAIEEGVSALIFGFAGAYDYFEGAERVDDAILASARAATVGLEVADAPLREWERAILAGYGVWRGLRASGAGTVVVDLEKGSLMLES